MACLRGPLPSSTETRLNCPTRTKRVARTAVSARCSPLLPAITPPFSCSVRGLERCQAARDGRRLRKQAPGAGRPRQHLPAPAGTARGRQSKYWSTSSAPHPTHFQPFFAIQSCAPPQVGPFPLTSTIWSGGVAPTVQPVSLMQPREACLWGECNPPALSVHPPAHPTSLQGWSPCSCPLPPGQGGCPLYMLKGSGWGMGCQSSILQRPLST